MKPVALTFFIYLNLFCSVFKSADAGEIRASAIESQQKLMNVFVVPKQELIAIQWKNLNTENLEIWLLNMTGEKIQETILAPGSTIAFFETQTLYAGEYIIRASNGKESLYLGYSTIGEYFRKHLFSLKSYPKNFWYLRF